MLKQWVVNLINEDGVDTTWSVMADTRENAMINAWKLYREVNHDDHEFPPNWANPTILFEEGDRVLWHGKAGTIAPWEVKVIGIMHHMALIAFDGGRTKFAAFLDETTKDTRKEA